MKFYEFLTKAPKVGTLVVIEGTEVLLAQRALDTLVARLLPDEGMRGLNLDVFGPELDTMAKVADAVAGMPFLAERRVAVFRNAQALRAAPRRELWAAAQTVPAGNTLVIEDLFPPNKKTKPEPFGAMAGRAALRIDTTANADTRERFIAETLTDLGANAEPRAVAALVESDADLSAVRNDLEKLALVDTTIRFADLARESLTIEDPKAWQYASALVEGRTADALAIAFELFANDPRGAAVPLASALATESGLLWELARPGGGELSGRNKWRERMLRPIAARVGERRARAAYEAAVRGFEAAVTGRIDDPRGMIEVLTAEVGGRIFRAQTPARR